MLLITGIWLKNHIRINYTSSMQKGIYFITDKEPTLGDIVTVCLPNKISQFGLARNYLSHGKCHSGSVPVVKRIAAQKDDLVEVKQNAVYINGYELPRSKVLNKDKEGRALLSVVGQNFLLDRNQYWLFGEGSSRSWDSRYYGPIDVKNIRNVLTPLIVW